MKILIDTNVILDFFLARKPNNESAKKLFELICQERVAAYTTASSITDIYYIVEKRLGDDVARGALKNLFNLVGIITVSGDDCMAAVDLPIPDYEDALIATCSAKEAMNYIVSNDSDFIKTDASPVRVIPSADFVAMFFV